MPLSRGHITLHGDEGNRDVSGIGGECGVPSELMVLENHEFERSTEEV